MGSFDHRDIEVFVDIDMAKQDHYAHAALRSGDGLFDRPVANDGAAINQLIDDAQRHGHVALVIDMSSSSAQLLLTICAHRQISVAYPAQLRHRRQALLRLHRSQREPSP